MTASIGIVQSLANEDPDVDAIYRLTQPLPFNFPSKGFNLAVPKGAYAPYNAQATLHLYSALWSLMLPVTIHGRVSDIWRGYAAQRIMSMLNLRLLFSPSLVKQVRNVHNYLADFDSENDLYLRSQKLLEQLEAWQPTQTALKSPHQLCAVIEELWIMLYEHGYVLMGDVDLTQVRPSMILHYIFRSFVSFSNAFLAGSLHLRGPYREYFLKPTTLLHSSTLLNIIIITIIIMIIRPG